MEHGVVETGAGRSSLPIEGQDSGYPAHPGAASTFGPAWSGMWGIESSRETEDPAHQLSRVLDDVN
jgi:hypothetical protein